MHTLILRSNRRRSEQLTPSIVPSTCVSMRVPTRYLVLAMWRYTFAAYLLASSFLIPFSCNDRERELRTLSLAIIALRGHERRGSKISFELQAWYKKKERVVTREMEEGSRRRAKTTTRWKEIAYDALGRTARLSRLAPSSCSCFSLFRGRPGKLHQPCAERCLKLNITRAERLCALKRYDSDNEEQSKALLCAPDDYGR